MSQPHDPYRRLASTRPASSGPVLRPGDPGRVDAAPVPDPGFWGDRPARGGGYGRSRLGGPLDRLRDVAVAWRSDARIGLAVLVAVAVVAGVVWYRVGAGGASASAGHPSRAGTTPSTRARVASSSTSAPPPRGRVVVHVAGAVVRPGVVELGRGSRVIDALEAAGGGVPEADLDRLNLAAKLVDGQRILVQRVGDPSVPGGSSAGPGVAGSGTSGTSGGTPGGTPGGTESGPLDLNAATLEDLDGLPGIGPTLAAAILAERDRRGGFRNINELREVRGIGEKRFADLRDLVTV